MGAWLACLPVAALVVGFEVAGGGADAEVFAAEVADVAFGEGEAAFGAVAVFAEGEGDEVEGVVDGGDADACGVVDGEWFGHGVIWGVWGFGMSARFKIRLGWLFKYYGG